MSERERFRLWENSARAVAGGAEEEAMLREMLALLQRLITSHISETKIHLWREYQVWYTNNHNSDSAWCSCILILMPSQSTSCCCQ